MRTHKTQILPALIAALAFLLVSEFTLARSDSDVLSHAPASVISDRSQLAPADRANPRASLSAFMSQRGANQKTIDSVAEASTFTDKAGRDFGRYEQRINGLRVYGAYAKVSMDRQGELIQIIERFAPAGSSVVKATIDDASALQTALTANFDSSASMPEFVSQQGPVSTFADTDFFHKGPSVERVVISRSGTRLEEGFLVENWSQDDNQLYYTLIDGRGRIIDNELRTSQDSYNIFPDHPGNSAQTITPGAGSGNAESPIGWLEGNQTSLFIRGNNVSAYLDRNNNNVPDGGGRSITDGNFLTSANLSQQPTTSQNQEVAVQNLFYLNNLIHDTLYSHGFVEAVGNFQNFNFGNGGSGNDAVNAEAQDGGSTNNANFATPNDGTSGRMQMYLWTRSSPQRDGDVDSDIVWHEYGHGLTWRMIGNMSGAISGAIGEGMSDVLAIIQNDDDRVGEYSFNNSLGIRSAPYTNYPRTLGDFSGSSVHFDGEIYAATIWLLKSIYNNAGLDDSVLLDDLVGGMNFTPSAPNYPQMRDGILQQVATTGGDICLVWDAFAQYGIGEGASMSVRRNRLTITESFAVPAECSNQPPPPPPPAEGTTLTGLTSSTRTQGRNRWRATVTASADVEAAVIAIDWSDGSSTSCTVSSGFCDSTLVLRNNISSITATIVSINGGAFNVAEGVSASISLDRP